MDKKVKKILLALVAIVIISFIAIVGVYIYFEQKEKVNNSINTNDVIAEELNLENNLVKELYSYVSDNRISSHLFVNNGFNKENITNSQKLILALQYMYNNNNYLEIRDSKPNESGPYISFREDYLKNTIYKIFGNYDYKNENVKFLNDFSSYNNLQSLEYNAINETYEGPNVQGGGGPTSRMGTILSSAKKIKDNTIELYVKTYYINLFELSGELEGYAFDYAVYKDFNYKGTERDQSFLGEIKRYKFSEFKGETENVLENEIRTVLLDKMNTFVYTFEKNNDTTGNYYLTSLKKI